MQPTGPVIEPGMFHSKIHLIIPSVLDTDVAINVPEMVNKHHPFHFKRISPLLTRM